MANTTTPTSLADIEKIYADMLKSQQAQALANKNSSLAGLGKEKTEANNNYAATEKNINANKVSTGNKYKDLYLGLDDKQADGTKDFYNKRDNTMYSNAQNVQAIRDYMAKNNLLSSGESVDALLRNNTDFSNSMGSLRSDEFTFDKGIGDTRNKYNRDEQQAYTQYDNELASALAEKNKLLQDITGREGTIGENYNTTLQSILDNINSQKAKAIFDYNQTLEQRKWEEAQAEAERQWKAEQAQKDRDLQTQLASASRSSSGGGSSYGSSNYSDSQLNNYVENDFRDDLFNEVDYSASNLSNMQGTKTMVENAYNQGYITAEERDSCIGKINNALNTMKQTQAQVNTGNYNGGNSNTASSYRPNNKNDMNNYRL